MWTACASCSSSGQPAPASRVHGNQTIALEQKYGGFTYIFDIGGSYESVVELYGGRVDRIGKDGPRVNPFALEPTESNIKFLYSLRQAAADQRRRGTGAGRRRCDPQGRAGYVPARPGESPPLQSLPAQEARPLSLEVGWQRRLQRHLRQRGRQPLAVARCSASTSRA